MDSTELYEHFRSDVVDTAKPYLWTEDEVWRYAKDAYRMFVRLTGGIADFTSAATEVLVTTGETTSPLHPSILRIMSAQRRSDGAVVDIINVTDLGTRRESDYGYYKRLLLDTTTGPVHSMVIGMQKDVARLLHIPTADDTIDLVIQRLPLVDIDRDGLPLDEIDDIHHLHLMLWMKHLAYAKQDAETFDKGKSEDYRLQFENYCAQAIREKERYKHKTRIVGYGGL